MSSKTPISCISPHPEHDNFILISSDNRIRLFDLSTESILKTYTCRHINPGTRITGHFSPCGTYVHSGSWDIKTFSSRGAADSSRGVFIWKTASGKLERRERKAMLESYERLKEEGEVVEGRKMWGVSVCRWVMIPDRGTRRSRQALVSAGIDKNIGFFL
jgi:WD40 repeat protein